MSVVTDVVLVYGLTDREDDAPRVLDAINALNDRGRLVHVEDPALPSCWFCNGKTLQANVAVGAFNYLDLEGWVVGMRRGIDFGAYGCDFVQMVVQEEHSVGFGIIEVWRADQTGEAAFDPERFEARVRDYCEDLDDDES